MSVIILRIPDSYSKVGLVVEAWSESEPGFGYLDQDFELSPRSKIRVSIPDEISSRPKLPSLPDYLSDEFDKISW